MLTYVCHKLLMKRSRLDFWILAIVSFITITSFSFTDTFAKTTQTLELAKAQITSALNLTHSFHQTSQPFELTQSLKATEPAVAPILKATEPVEVPIDEISSAANWQYASFPVENFVSYTSPFGYRNSATGGANREFHSGLDIAGPNGSYLRNWWVGEVVDLSDNTACGTMLVIQSGNWQHVYCHMQGRVEGSGSQRYFVDRGANIAIGLGQTIPTGVRIGRIGMTGRTTGPHLHWGLKYAGNYVDPADVLREMHKQQMASG